MEACLCYVTCRDRDEAIRIGRTVVVERLAAAANVLGDTVSIYRWGGELHEKPETALVLKTRAELAERLVARVRALHSYECPCLLVLPVSGGNPAYLDWIGAETEQDGAVYQS
jgi:periplasmic divalent cation tolerance protein